METARRAWVKSVGTILVFILLVFQVADRLRSPTALAGNDRRSFKLDERSSGRSTIPRTANPCSSSKRASWGLSLRDDRLLPTRAQVRKISKESSYCSFRWIFQALTSLASNLNSIFRFDSISAMLERLLELLERIHVLDCGGERSISYQGAQFLVVSRISARGRCVSN